MKKYRAILFDMDGTLVPMDINAFTKGYFAMMCKKMAPLGLAPEKIVEAIWAGTKAMYQNDGKRSNENVFWSVFKALTGKGQEEVDPYCLSFYSNEFKDAIAFTSPNPHAKEAVELARSKAEFVILSTNPVFPYPGQVTRMGYVGLKPEDFDLVTSYETSYHCKPNPAYFADILVKFGLKPEECLLIGNDEFEDAWCASQLGIETYLVTDCLIPSDKYHHAGYRGSFEDLLSFLRSL